MEWEGERWVPGLELAISAGTEWNRNLETKDLLVQSSAQLLYTVRIGTAALRVGPVAGVAFVQQDSPGHGEAASAGASLGGRVRGDTQGLGLYLLADVRGLMVSLVTNGGKRLAVESQVVGAAGLRAAF